MQIDDNEFCADKGSRGAHCVTTLSGQKRDLTKEEWDLERFGMFCTKSDGLANWKEAILILCRKSRRCTYEDEQQIEAVGAKAEELKREVLR